MDIQMFLIPQIKDLLSSPHYSHRSGAMTEEVELDSDSDQAIEAALPTNE